MDRATDLTSIAPVAHIPLGDEINLAIKAFAESKGLFCESYHDGLPVWIVQENEHSERVRRVQVIAYVVEGETHLSLTASVQVYVDNKTFVPKVIDSELFAGGAVLTRPKPDRARLFNRLISVWDRSAILLECPHNQLIRTPTAEEES